MEIWLNWLIGFIIWFFFAVIIALSTWLITGVGLRKRTDLPEDAFNYHHKSDILPENGFFLDTHAHTVGSDGVLTPEQLIKWHIANNYHAFVLTDHNTGKMNPEIMSFQSKYPEILIIPGVEWTTMRIHLNFLGIMDYPHRIPQYPSDEEIKYAIKEAKKLGAVVQVDHITWTKNEPKHRDGSVVHPTREQLVDWGVDGFEINNETRWYDPKTVLWLNKMREEKKLPRPIYVSTGTDIHSPLGELASGWTELLITEEDKKKPTWDIVKKALLDASTRIWVDHDYYRPNEIKYLKLEQKLLRERICPPLFALKHGIEKMPGTIAGAGLYVFWFLIAYFPLRLLFEWIISL